jgi:hypothetical protein
MQNIMKKITIVFALAIGFSGCGQREQQAAIVVAPAVAGEDSNSASMNPTGDTPPGQNGATNTVPVTQTTKPPSSFEYPPDLTGKAVVKAISPEPPALTATERFGMAPKPRTVPTKILNPEMIAKANYIPPPIMNVMSTAVTISPPQEKVPFDLGFGADKVPAKPTLPIAAVITERARDVNLPPSIPILGRPLNERVSLDDPTSEFANAAIVSPGVNVPLKSAEFVKVALPDPFELGEQVKPKVPSKAEPGLSPVSVNPQRVK